jgi:hypothetical protein
MTSFLESWLLSTETVSVVFFVVSVAVVCAFLYLNEKSKRFNPGLLHTRPSALWSDLATLTFDELDIAISERRRDAGFTVHPGNEAKIYWHGSDSLTPLKSKTNLAVIYIHGWSACPDENMNVSLRLAQALGANLFVQRLSGHGKSCLSYFLQPKNEQSVLELERVSNNQKQ